MPALPSLTPTPHRARPVMGGGLPTNNHLALEVVGHSFTSPPSHRTLVVISALGHPRPIDDVFAISASPPIATDLLHHGEGRKRRVARRNFTSRRSQNRA
jgi:hypothetical protein